MMEVIDRIEILKKLENKEIVRLDKNGLCDIDEVLSIVRYGVPTVDAVPVRHGRWVAFNVIDTKDYSSKIRYMCNKCGRYEDEQEPYCNCGAKMDGGAPCE